jgi:hypothetical protein
MKEFGGFIINLVIKCEGNVLDRKIMGSKDFVFFSQVILFGKILEYFFLFGGWYSW